jgi:hypothetical protein
MNSKLIRSTLALAALLVCACGGAPPAQASTTPSAAHEVAGAWERLGERTVNGAVDRDVITVGARDGRFRSMQIRVDGNTVEMFDIVVTFGDGEKFSPPTRLVFDKNTRSRVIDLPGKERVIQKVEFKYGKLPHEGRAVVELWAKSA